MAEAYTCSGACTSKITDEGFSFDQRGQMTTYYQSSPNSSGYYVLNASYWESKSLKTVSGLGLPTITYGLDSEGRVNSVSASGSNPVSSVTYNNGSYSSEPLGALLQVTLGSGDTQNFTYNPNTGRVTQYSASVGATPTTISGTLTWNVNGTLASNNIVDAYNAADTQNCTYAYDDFIRAASVNCLNGSTNVWNQTFTYGSDSFGNLTKSSAGPGLSWSPGYNSANNEYTLSGTSYDANGNLIADTFHTYTWLADGHIASVQTGSTTASVTYDAMGNKVEENIGGVVNEYVAAFGISAQMTGQTEHATSVSLPGGVEALYSGGSLQRFRYPDWQGTIRAESNPATRVFTESLAFAPFGERYAVQGAPYNVDSFTGQPDQITSDEYDFTARELHNGQGRWISPDPLRGVGNKYVYADNNPLSEVDLGGLLAVEPYAIDWAGQNGGYLMPGLSPIDGKDGNELLLHPSQVKAPTDQNATNSESGTAQQQSGPTAKVKGNTVTYTYPDGSKVVLKGDHPFRDNNPGDLRSGHGSIGRDGGFAIYPSLQAGVDALGATLTGKYGDSSIADTMKAFAPASDGNDPVKYAATLASAVGVPASTKISALSSAQLMTFQYTIANAEGYSAAGNTASYTAPPQ